MGDSSRGPSGPTSLRAGNLSLSSPSSHLKMVGPSLERDSGHQLPGTVLEFPSKVLDSLESDGFSQVTYPL